jgi:lipoic acid synthetase
LIWPECLPRPENRRRHSRGDSAQAADIAVNSRSPISMPTLGQPEALIQIMPMGERALPRPQWLRVRVPGGENFHALKKLARGLQLHTVCESAQCPNIAECWHHRTATFMLLGNLCTRRCGFCAVPKGRPEPIDRDEPRRLAEAVEALGLRHAVVTSVNRDDDNLGGARVFAAAIAAIRERVPECRVEVLIPDFKGSEEALAIVLGARPDVLNHNTETVPSLYRFVRPGAKFERSLRLLRRAKATAPAMPTKSGLMVGLGETEEELIRTFAALAATGCDILTVGQYLRPSMRQLPVKRYYPPEDFARLREAALGMGFTHVEAGPLVRSSYHAHEHVAEFDSEARSAGQSASA